MKPASKRYLSILMVTAMLFSLMPFNVLAAKELQFVSLATATPPVYDMDAGTVIGTLYDIDPSTNELTIPSRLWNYTDGGVQYTYFAMQLQHNNTVSTFTVNGKTPAAGDWWIFSANEAITVGGQTLSPTKNNEKWYVARIPTGELPTDGTFGFTIDTDLGDGGHSILGAAYASGMTISKTANVSKFVLGTLITYTVVLTNAGEQALTGIVFTDSLMPNISNLTRIESNPGTANIISVGETWTYTYTYTATAADVADGFITNTATGDSNETNLISDSVTLQVYAATGSLNLSGTKILEGRALAAGEFEFEVLEGATAVSTAANAADGSITFPQIAYTLADVGTHTYTIREKTSGLGGVADASNTYTLVVTVTDNGNGTLGVSGSTALNIFNFTNIYTAAGEYDIDLGLNPTKVLTGRALTDGAFTFQLKQGDTVLQTAANTADGNIPFSALSFDQDELGEHSYTILEIAGAEAGMTYDPMILSFTIVVTDLGEGELNAVLKAVPGDTVFNNTYTAAGEYDIDLGLNPTKVLTGRALTDGAFTFQLKQGDTVLQTAANTADGNIPFSALSFDQDELGEHSYTILGMSVA